MRMTRWIALAMAAVLALAVAGIAVAHKNGGQPQATEEVAATFEATPDPEKTKTKQCTGVDGTYAITKSVAKGTAQGHERLSGNLTIKSKSVVNTQTGLGWSDGKTFTTDPATGKLKWVSGFSAVIKEGSKLEGLARGKVKSPSAGATKAKDGRRGSKRGLNSSLRANFSATVADDGKITGSIGGGGGDNSAIIHGNPCAKQRSSNDNRHEGRGDDNKGGRHEGRGDDDDKKGDDNRHHG
jgi:hypothetical protein